MKFRTFKTSLGLEVLFGKSSSSNEDLMKTKKPNDLILHTNDPGSPFCILSSKAEKKDLKEAAIACACFSQQWKNKKKKANVSVFRGGDVYKDKRAKQGTFHVRKYLKIIKVKLELFIGLQDKEIKAIPKNCLKEPLIKIWPGNIKKEKAAEIIKDTLKRKYNINIKKEKILQIIPAGGFSIK